MALGTQKNFGNSLLLENFDYRVAGNFGDENWIMNNLLDGGETAIRTHLGMLSLFNQFQVVPTPLTDITEKSGNTIFLNGDNGEMTFDVNYSLEMPTIKEDLTGDNDRVGIDGQIFEVVIGDGSLNAIFSVNHLIKSDLRDGQEFIIREVGQRQSNGGFLYKLQLLTDNKYDYVDKRQLAIGTQYFISGSLIGEYDEHFPGMNQSAGTQRFLHRLGGKRGVEFTLTGNAQRLKLDAMKGATDGFEGAIAPFLDPKNPRFLQAIGYNNGKGKIDYGKGVSIVPMFELLMYKELMLQRERAWMYGNGGVVQDQRNKYKRSSMGLYNQMKLGNWIKVPKYTKDTIIMMLSQVFKNRPDIADVDRFIELECGRGAVIEFTRLFTMEGAAIANALGLVLDNSSIKVIKGDAMNLSAGYRFTSVFFPGFGTVRIKHNPALDSEFNRYMDEPKIGGLPKFSYTAMVFDLSDGKSTNAFSPSKDVKFANGFNTNANMYTIKNEAMPTPKYTYINGRTSAYPISVGKGQLAVSRFDGMTIMLEEQSDVWLADPGKTLLFQLE